MSAGVAAAPELVQRGRTAFATRALQRLGVGIVADASGADPREIVLRWTDANGGLHAALTLPLTVHDERGRTLEEQGAELRSALVGGMRERAGRRVDGVDLRFSGIRREKKRRVR